MSYSKAGHHPDYFLMALVFVLVLFGLVMLSSAGSELGKIRFNDSYYYLKHQVYNGLIVGLIGFFLAYKIRYQYYKKLALPLLIGTFVLLGLIFTSFGVALGGATRWLSFGPITFQPSEILKLTFIIYLAAWLSNEKENRKRSFWQGFLPFLIVVGVMAGLLLKQPSTSMVVILVGAALVVYFASGAKLKYFIGTLLLVAIGIGAITYFTPYRLERITSFLNKTEDSLGSDYHRNEALIALGSGGVFGVGYGESKTKTNYLPAPVDDSIFAVIGEELGFVGAGSLVALFGMLTFRLFWIARKLRDKFGQLMLIGFASVIAIQSLINIGAISGVFPLTGIPLPFISYGGTSLAIFLTMAGIALNASKYTSR